MGRAWIAYFVVVDVSIYKLRGCVVSAIACASHLSLVVCICCVFFLLRCICWAIPLFASGCLLMVVGLGVPDCLKCSALPRSARAFMHACIHASMCAFVDGVWSLWFVVSLICDVSLVLSLNCGVLTMWSLRLGAFSSCGVAFCSRVLDLLCL